MITAQTCTPFCLVAGFKVRMIFLWLLCNTLICIVVDTSRIDLLNI